MGPKAKKELEQNIRRLQEQIRCLNCKNCVELVCEEDDQVPVWDTVLGKFICGTIEVVDSHDPVTLNADQPTQDSANLVDQELQLVPATETTYGVIKLEDIPPVHDEVTLNADQPTQDAANLVGQELQFNPATSTTYGVVKLEDLFAQFNRVANYSALPDPTLNADEYYHVENSQGTAWLPGSLGGTYYSKGFYYSDGVSWIFVGEVPYQATQGDVDAGVITDQFVSPATLNSATTVSHPGHTHVAADVTDLATEVVTSISKSGSAQLVGDVTLSEGANITLTQVGNDIEIASAGGGVADADYGDITVSGSGTVWNIDAGTVGDTETGSIYALLAGRAGSQILNGGNAANEDLTLNGTAHATKTTSYVLLQTGGGNVGIGTTSALSNLTLHQSSGATSANGFRFTGNSIGGTSSGTGFLFSLGYNASGNKQIWFGDPDGAGNVNYSFARFGVFGSGSLPTIDGVSGNNAVRRKLQLGTAGDSNSGVYVGSILGVDGYVAIGNGYYTTAAPTNGMIVQGNVGLGLTIVTATLHIKAGTATANTAPLKFTSGTNLTTAETGAVEYNGTNLFFTRTGTTRQTVLTANVVTTEVVTSDTTVTINIDGTDYKLLAKA